MMKHYMNGKWVSQDKLVLPITDLAVSRGLGVFDYLCTYNQKPFHLKEHVRRFKNSVGHINLELPLTQDEICDLVIEAIGKNKNEAEEFGIKIFLSGGVSSDGTTPGKPSFIIFLQPFTPFDKECYTQGIIVHTLTQTRHIPEAKSVAYLAGLVALQQARKEGAKEVIYIDEQGYFYEGITSNVFAVIDGRLHTANKDVLGGITRELIIKLAQDNGIECIQKPFRLNDLSEDSELFISSTNRDVMPIVKVDNTKIGHGKPGPVSRKLLKVLREYIVEASK